MTQKQQERFAIHVWWLRSFHLDTTFIWIQVPGYNPPPGNFDINAIHSARCFMRYCRCCEVLQLKKDMQMDPLIFLIHGAKSRLQVTTLWF